MMIYQVRKITRPQGTRMGVAQKGRNAIWTSEARLKGDRHGCLESYGGSA